MENNSKKILSEISPGELLDKISILEIKLEMVKDPEGLKEVKKEHAILKKIQNSKIHSKKVKWIKKIENINYGPVIFIGNEFFDSLPIKQIYKKKNFLFEKYVKL